MTINQADRIKTFNAPSVWLEFSPLAQITNSINLGQGFPNWAPPLFVQEFAKESVKGVDYSIYARSAGHINLAHSISKTYSRKLDFDIDPKTNILVTVGATEALFLSIMSFINKDDEVIVLEPAFDVYYGALEMAQAKVVSVPMILPENSSTKIEIDFEALKQSLTSKTKAIIINTPHNPSGKVLSQEEINTFAKTLSDYPNCLVISDEVYEHLVYDDHTHTPVASHKDLKDKTISIYSAGKTFSVTGWKIGWAIGPKDLISKLQLSQQWVVFSVSTPHQEAIAKSLINAEKEYKGFNSFYEYLKNDYSIKRDLLYNGLTERGFNSLLPEGSFFILSNIQNQQDDKKLFSNNYNELIDRNNLKIDQSTKELRDYNYSRYLCLETGVTTIPNSAFYASENKKANDQWIRFAFCKEIETLKSAIELL